MIILHFKRYLYLKISKMLSMYMVFKKTRFFLCIQIMNQEMAISYLKFEFLWHWGLNTNLNFIMKTTRRMDEINFKLWKIWNITYFNREQQIEE